MNRQQRTQLSDGERWANICDAMAQDALTNENPLDSAVIESIRERIESMIVAPPDVHATEPDDSPGPNVDLFQGNDITDSQGSGKRGPSKRNS